MFGCPDLQVYYHLSCKSVQGKWGVYIQDICWDPEASLRASQLPSRYRKGSIPWEPTVLTQTKTQKELEPGHCAWK